MKYGCLLGNANHMKSHLLREMWIEILLSPNHVPRALSHLLREMWIEINPSSQIMLIHSRVISCGRCGLKFFRVLLICPSIGVISCGRCGLKFYLLPELFLCRTSHLLREMWIEIFRVCLNNLHSSRVISCGRCGLKS